MTGEQDDATVGPLADVRRSYRRASLEIDDLDPAERADPLLAVRRWLATAVDTGHELEPTAMTIATVGPGADGEVTPDARIVLCKAVDHGVVWFTNLASPKGRQLTATPRAAAVFLWASLERQVRLRGAVEAVDDATNDAYFASRPRGNQLSAWASHQSEPVPDRATIERRAEEVADRFAGGPVPRPPHWGGLRLVPTTVELWQGGVDRLHDRLRWTRDGDGWQLERLQP